MARKNVVVRIKKKKAQEAERTGRLVAAREMYRELCAADAADAQTWFRAGTVHGRLGDLEAAVHCLRTATQLEPENAEMHVELGRVLQAAGRRAESVACYEAALRLRPECAEALQGLAELATVAGDHARALFHYRRALTLRPESSALHCQAGRAALLLGRETEALDHFRQAIAADPASVPALLDLAFALMSTGQLEEALSHCRHARELDPRAGKGWAGEARVLARMGDPGAAFTLLRPFLDAATSDPDIVLSLAEIADRFGCASDVAVLGERILTGGPHSCENTAQLRFALGALYDHLGRYDAAFDHYQAANALLRPPWHPETFERDVDALIEVFSPEALHRLPRATARSELPVFVIGMPRSGTTLVEQILAGHPQVHGAGELPDIPEIAAELTRTLGMSRPFPACVERLTANFAQNSARRYLEGLAARAPDDARRVIDKMPHNFLYLGLIALLMPGARVIHCQRDPLDTCLSCYFQNFGARHPYSHDLADLGRYYRAYLRLMAHWRAVLDMPLLEVRYEALVARQEEVSRSMIAFCALEWDARCLRFHENRGIVITASHEQVQRPLYASSVQRWRHYDRHLDPLRRALFDDP